MRIELAGANAARRYSLSCVTAGDQFDYRRLASTRVASSMIESVISAPSPTN